MKSREVGNSFHVMLCGVVNYAVRIAGVSIMKRAQRVIVMSRCQAAKTRSRPGWDTAGRVWATQKSLQACALVNSCRWRPRPSISNSMTSPALR
jgi:hypothetical protein